MDRDLEFYNGYPIKNLATAKRLDTFLTPSKETAEKEAPAQLLRVQETASKPRIIAGDASAVATCALEVDGNEGFFTQYELSPEERNFSSGQRELLTVLRALQTEQEFFRSLTNQTIIWITDSTNLVSFLTKGTMKMPIQRQVLEVYKLLRHYSIRVAPVHLKRTDYRIQWADEGSRFFDPDDWSIDKMSYTELTNEYTPSVDLFAHSSNTKCVKFYSYANASNTAGVDAFAQDWTGETAWLCPPIHLIPDAIKKVESTRMSAIFIVPEWRTAAFWALLFPNGGNAVQSCTHIKRFRPFLLRGEFCQNKLLQGHTKFAFLAMFLDSKGAGYAHESGRVAWEAETRNA